MCNGRQYLCGCGAPSGGQGPQPLVGQCVPHAGHHLCLSVCLSRAVLGSQAGAQGGMCFVLRVCGQDTGEQASRAEFGI